MARGDGALARRAGSPHGAGAGRGGVRLLCFVFFPDLKSSQLGELRSGSQNVTPNEVAPSNPGENLALNARREFCLCGRREAADQERTVPCAGRQAGTLGDTWPSARGGKVPQWGRRAWSWLRETTAPQHCPC